MRVGGLGQTPICSPARGLDRQGGSDHDLGNGGPPAANPVRPGLCEDRRVAAADRTPPTPNQAHGVCAATGSDFMVPPEDAWRGGDYREGDYHEGHEDHEAWISTNPFVIIVSLVVFIRSCRSGKPVALARPSDATDRIPESRHSVLGPGRFAPAASAGHAIAAPPAGWQETGGRKQGVWIPVRGKVQNVVTDSSSGCHGSTPPPCRLWTWWLGETHRCEFSSSSTAATTRAVDFPIAQNVSAAATHSRVWECRGCAGC